MTDYRLVLYVAGRNAASIKAIENAKRLMESQSGGAYTLEVVDVLEHPQLAEDEKILAVPTLIKKLPLPLRRVIGDLSNSEKVLIGLDIRPISDD